MKDSQLVKYLVEKIDWMGGVKGEADRGGLLP